MKHQCNQNHRSQFFQKDNVDLEESEGTSIKSKKKSPEAAQGANEEESGSECSHFVFFHLLFMEFRGF